MLKEDLPEGESFQNRSFSSCKWLNTKEAAFYLRTTPGAIRTRVYRGNLIPSYFGRELRFLRTDLEKLLIKKGEYNGS